jgi:hypothetical protein
LARNLNSDLSLKELIEVLWLNIIVVVKGRSELWAGGKRLDVIDYMKQQPTINNYSESKLLQVIGLLNYDLNNISKQFKFD